MVGREAIPPTKLQNPVEQAMRHQFSYIWETAYIERYFRDHGQQLEGSLLVPKTELLWG